MYKKLERLSSTMSLSTQIHEFQQSSKKVNESYRSEYRILSITRNKLG